MAQTRLKYISWQKNLEIAFGQLFPGPKMTPKRATAYLLKYMNQLLPKISWAYPKSAYHKITPKETLTYSMRYMPQNLPRVATDVASHKNSSVG